MTDHILKSVFGLVSAQPPTIVKIIPNVKKIYETMESDTGIMAAAGFGAALGIMGNLFLEAKYHKCAPSKEANHGNIRTKIDMQ